jgi:cytochrome P450
MPPLHQLGILFAKIVEARNAPLANNYVLSTCMKTDLGESSLLYKLKSNKENFSQTAIAAECMDHMAAGIDTTGDALCLLMYQLSLPESHYVQENLYKELSENPSKSQDDLEYLDAVVMEGLRCFPPIPMSQPRYVPPGGRTIDGYFIPGGTIVSCQAYSVHRLNEDVYAHGDVFSPERWLEEGKKLESNRLFFAFGAGGRGCTGKQQVYNGTKQ